MVVGSISTLVTVFLGPCVGPIPSVGLTLTWSMGRKLALHITLSLNLLYLLPVGIPNIRRFISVNRNLYHLV